MQPSRQANPLRGNGGYVAPQSQGVPVRPQSNYSGTVVVSTNGTSAPATSMTSVTTVTTVANPVFQQTTFVAQTGQGVNPRAVTAHVIPQNNGSPAVTYNNHSTIGRRF